MNPFINHGYNKSINNIELLVSQQADGVYGSLTVRGPQDDPSLERILLLSSRPPTPLSRHSHLHPPTPSELLLNGQVLFYLIRQDATV